MWSANDHGEDQLPTTNISDRRTPPKDGFALKLVGLEEAFTRFFYIIILLNVFFDQLDELESAIH